MRNIYERLDELEAKMRDEGFRTNTGLGNEVGYYVFDYEPQEELIVRERVKEIERSNTVERFGYELVIFDLYELILQLLKDEGVYEDLLAVEEEEGTEYAFEAISDVLRFNDEDSLIIQHIIENTPEESVVLLTGVGKCFPILRSHKILNNLHQVMDHCPVIMLYPGRYTGNTLNIFGKVKDDNYYRAFPIVGK